jgi:hypothetical protein
VISFDEWRARFLELDQCPWRGPRPMEPGDENLLIGRAGMRDSFVQEVLTHQLVVLHGESGVGKSSLLNAGLVNDLRDRGFFPVVCRNWTRDPSSPDRTEDFVAGKVAAELAELGIAVSDGSPGSMISQLDADYGDQAVLVLDQFEELIRHQRAFFLRAMNWVLELNRERSVHVVISLRSEYVHRLKLLNSRVRPFSMSTVELEAVTSADDIRDIVASGNPNGEGCTAAWVAGYPNASEDSDLAGELAISHRAIELVVDEWQKLQHVEFRSGDIGLLHLQGVLYALYARGNGKTVCRADVEAMTAAADGEAQDLFMLGLGESVSRRLDLCEQACRCADPNEALDEALIIGTRSAVQRTVAHLSSGGFKLDREAWDLAELALERELRVLHGVPAEQAEAAFRILYGRNLNLQGGHDLLSADRSAIAFEVGMPSAPAAAPGSKLSELGIGISPWDADPKNLSAGPMLGYSPDELLIEEFRRFAFALEWLATAWLVRPTSPAVDSTMLSLIHDGFGDALERWADAQESGPAAALTLLTGAQGEVFDWTDRVFWPPFDGGNTGLTFVNLRWRNCRVSARIRNVVFANCDFRGTRFEECWFEGAVFLNCLLDGATFGDCDIVGAPRPPAKDITKDGMPSFELRDVNESTRIALTRYRGEDFSASALYSVTSGIAVTTRRDLDSELLEWSRQPGGLTMYGGRLSSLMVRSCRFRDGGQLALRHIAGSSLDIAEQGAVTVDIFGSSIRGLSISRSPGGQVESGEVDLMVRKSVLANTWFDSDLSGTATFDDSQVWQLVNVSDADNFRVTITDCTRYGVVNIGDTAGAGPVAAFTEDVVEDRIDLIHQARLMAYRRDPAMVELGGSAD